MASQEVFQTCYRGRQSFLHHMGYMRMAKVLLTQHVLRVAGISLENKSFFDYGFGAGTFFRYCPPSAQLFGVELGPLQRHCGHAHVCLEAVEVESWETHRLLRRPYHIVLCSHVLEHLADPVAFIRRIKSCLSATGSFVALVPINERRANPNHLQVVDVATVRAWAGAAGLEVRLYVESDPWAFTGFSRCSLANPVPGIQLPRP